MLAQRVVRRDAGSAHAGPASRRRACPARPLRYRDRRCAASRRSRVARGTAALRGLTRTSRARDLRAFALRDPNPNDSLTDAASGHRGRDVQLIEPWAVEHEDAHERCLPARRRPTARRPGPRVRRPVACVVIGVDGGRISPTEAWSALSPRSAAARASACVPRRMTIAIASSLPSSLSRSSGPRGTLPSSAHGALPLRQRRWREGQASARRPYSRPCPCH